MGEKTARSVTGCGWQVLWDSGGDFFVPSGIWKVGNTVSSFLLLDICVQHHFSSMTRIRIDFNLRHEIGANSFHLEGNRTPPPLISHLTNSGSLSWNFLRFLLLRCFTDPFPPSLRHSTAHLAGLEVHKGLTSPDLWVLFPNKAITLRLVTWAQTVLANRGQQDSLPESEGGRGTSSTQTYYVIRGHPTGQGRGPQTTKKKECKLTCPENPQTSLRLPFPKTVSL